ncbi:ribokinase [Mycolicibacterium sp. BK556]|uniref:ribokinase n=1 Tax=unclassified Mycolicibacterium TaxID=2636767 RepID=UPI00161EB773|nr:MULTISPECIES: ribokinase [unclassified Mycolicibacterium]MBB3603188.1 ribokinase [Mycolicibacterium sp. BK556]MBB3633383.1 ribokinase [Mycolicibacterium sp. BK607]
MTRVCVVGSVNVDQFFRVTALPHAGETVLGSAVTTEPGGKGGNQAVAAARAGADAQFVGAVGTDPAGAGLRAHLRANGVELDGLQELGAPSGSAVILVDDRGENMIVVAPGANGHLTLNSAAARAVIADCEVLLVQLEVPIATAVAAAREARSVGATVIVNASPVSTDAGLSELADVTDIVIVNEAEEPHWPWPTRHLVVTRGSRGATHRSPDGDVEVPSPEVEAIDTTGAGDVFAGVLAADWLAGHERALRRACAAGALATLVPGAGDCAPTAEAIDDVLTQY